jgi:hypothetical protein
VFILILSRMEETRKQKRQSDKKVGKQTNEKREINIENGGKAVRKEKDML